MAATMSAAVSADTMDTAREPQSTTPKPRRKGSVKIYALLICFGVLSMASIERIMHPLKRGVTGWIKYTDSMTSPQLQTRIMTEAHTEAPRLAPSSPTVAAIKETESPTKSVSSSESQSESPFALSSCTGYLKFPSPAHHTGLPQLADVFASHDATQVTFVAKNRGKCEEEWETADRFASYISEDDDVYHRFLCVFHEGHNTEAEEGNTNGSANRVYVLSDYVLSTHPHDPAFLIQCKLPRQFRHLIRAGQLHTSLHVDLYSIEDLEAPKMGYNHQRLMPSNELDANPRIKDIPLCHPASAHETKNHNLPPESFRLIAFTPLKSNYAVEADKGYEDSTMWSSVNRIPEWLEYHRTQGFDHFVIYDNDEEPDGPIYQKVLPYIQSGLVSYRWYPLQNCMSATADRRMDEAQITGSLAAFHRIGYSAKYFAYHDGDEFFVPLVNDNAKAREEIFPGDQDDSIKTVADVADAIFEEREDLDVLQWRAYVMAPCNGTHVRAGGSILEKWKCRTDRNYADVKLILRVRTMFFFAIHYPVLTKHGDKPNEYELDNTSEGFLAHYRVESNPEGQKRDDYEGLIKNHETNRVDYIDNALSQQRGLATPDEGTATTGSIAV